MNLFKTVAVAFSMFSAIPMPQFEWEEKNTKYMMCAFPLIGVVCGGALWAWYWIASILELNATLIGIGMTLLPIIATGGVHMDGYCDTMDARSSHGERDKKLEILSDPHIGAFGVLAMICYFLLYFGCVMGINYNRNTLMCITLIFVISRCFSTRSIASLTCAKKTGLAHAFSDMASKKHVKIFAEIMIVAGSVVQIFLNPIRGCVMVLASFLIYIWWKRMMVKEFGGMTGDLTGYLVQKMELYLVAIVMLLG